MRYPGRRTGYNFTDRMRRVLALAREEAIEHRHEYVGTEHILLGLLRDGEGMAVHVIGRHAGLAAVRSRIEARLRKGKVEISSMELPYTSQAKQSLARAMEVARATRCGYVGTEHLLLGLIAMEKSVAAVVLEAFGLDYETAEREVIDATIGGSPERRFAVEIDDASSVSMYEQIVSRVREAVATGALKAGDRVPTVRRLADDLDIAPGTVARAYTELEQLGIVVTEGSRGTRVATRASQSLPDADRPDALTGLLRPVAVAAFHLGATASELRAALEAAMLDIFPGDPPRETGRADA